MNRSDESASPRRWPWFVGSFAAGLLIGAVLGALAYLALLMLTN